MIDCKKTFLICDENENLKVYIKLELWSHLGRKSQIVKELKDCKNISVALEKKNSFKKYNSIMLSIGEYGGKKRILQNFSAFLINRLR